jgi:hypothetical protein
VKEYRFEIARRGYRRFTWRFVVINGDRRRVLARARRDYRSPKAVKRVIDRLREAEVVDLSGANDDGRFPLPTTSFRIVPGVVPLMVTEGPVEYEPPPVQPAVREEAAEDKPAKAASKPRRSTRGAKRGAKKS